MAKNYESIFTNSLGSPGEDEAPPAPKKPKPSRRKVAEGKVTPGFIKTQQEKMLAKLMGTQRGSREETSILKRLVGSDRILDSMTGDTDHEYR